MKTTKPRTMSEEARKRISLAQTARHAKARGQQPVEKAGEPQLTREIVNTVAPNFQGQFRDLIETMRPYTQQQLREQLDACVAIDQSMGSRWDTQAYKDLALELTSALDRAQGEQRTMHAGGTIHG